MVSKRPYLLPEVPKPTHGEGDGLKPIKTARDSIGDLEAVEPRDSPGLVALPDNQLVNHHVKVNRSYDDGETLKANKPAHTMMCGHAVGHYNLNRACTNLECARIQGFPDKWKFAGSERQVRMQIGNAVPVGLATAMAEAIYDVYHELPSS